LLNHGVERKRLADHHLDRSFDLARRIADQNTAGERIRGDFFDTRFALECHLDSSRQSRIPS